MCRRTEEANTQLFFFLKHSCFFFLYLFKYMHQSNPWLKNERNQSMQASEKFKTADTQMFSLGYFISVKFTTLILKPTHSSSGRSSEMHH